MGQSGLTVEGKVHDFKERLAFSQRSGDEPFWQGMYAKAFPGALAHRAIGSDCQGQRLGIDRLVYLSSGRTLYIDEKSREKDYSDICLEYISNDSTRSLGWMEKDLLIDYLAYAFIPSKTCYLFDWPMLRKAWLENKRNWIETYFNPVAPNRGYNTISVAVPIETLLAAVESAKIIRL